jgi:hypothetical protein
MQVNALVLVASLVLGQTPTVNGLVKSLNDAVATITPQNPATISANKLVSFGVQRAAGTNAIRCVIRLDEEKRLFLGLPAGTITEPADLYAVMQVAGPPVAVTTKHPMPPWMEEMIETCGQVFALPSPMASVILAARSNPIAQAASTGFACACSTGSNCTWTPPLPGGGFGPPEAAPKNMTIPPGRWAGAGCSLKTCLEMFGFDSMPNVCK